MKKMLASILLLSVTAGVLATQPATPRTRRVLYNFDGCSCMFTKAGGKGPVPITVDDVKRLLEEVAYDESRVDTVLVCVNAQVMYYPTKVGTTMRDAVDPRTREVADQITIESEGVLKMRALILMRSCWRKRSGAAVRHC